MGRFYFEALILCEDKEHVYFKVLEFLQQAAGPADLKALDPVGLTQPKMKARVVVGEIATAATYLRHLYPVVGLSHDTGPYSVPIASGSH